MIDDLSEFWISIKSVLRLTVYDEMTNSFADVRAWSVVDDTIRGHFSKYGTTSSA